MTTTGQPATASCFGWTYTLCPHSIGMIIEDVWPTVFFGWERVEEIRRKPSRLDWARDTLDTMKREAERVTTQPPQLPIERIGWRHDFYSTTSGEHLVYEPDSPDRFYDPRTGRYETGDAHHRAWVLLTHERTYRLMRSIGFLYALTGDERYAEWVAVGMRSAIEMFSRHELREDNHYDALYFHPLYDAQILLLLANAYGLTRTSHAYDVEDHEQIRTDVFDEAQPYQIGFLREMGAHNMTCYVAANLATAGLLFDWQGWVDLALGAEQAGLVRNITDGLKTDPAGDVDGFWYEGTMFYHFYSLAPLITLWEAARTVRAEIARDPSFAERLARMFQAPVLMADPQLRLPCLGDLGAPKVLSLTLYRHLYEYAAGQIDPERFGPVLARIYATGLPRRNLTGLAFGPDALPPPSDPPGHTHLPAAGIGVFRGGCQAGDAYLLFRAGRQHGGHDHQDKLAISLHACGVPISPDLGTAGYSLTDLHAYYRSTFSHNTLLVDDANQQPVSQAKLDFCPHASPPYAVAEVGDAYDGVRLRRVVIFDPPLIVIADEFTSHDEHRYAAAWHAYGSMTASVSHPVETPDWADLGNEGGLAHFTERRTMATHGCAIVDWRVNQHLWLRQISRSDGLMEVTAGRTPGQPISDDRGTILLRATDKARRFTTVWEIHRGRPTVTESAIAVDEEIHVTADGEVKQYAPPRARPRRPRA